MYIVYCRPGLHKLGQHVWGTDSPCIARLHHSHTKMQPLICTFNFHAGQHFRLKTRQHPVKISKDCFRKFQLRFSFIRCYVSNSHWTMDILFAFDMTEALFSYQETTLTHFIEGGSIAPHVSVLVWKVHTCNFHTCWERAARNFYNKLKCREISTWSGTKSNHPILDSSGVFCVEGA